MRAPLFWFTPPDRPAILARALAPISALFAAGTANRLRRPPKIKADIPVICVGNINAGGTGKTPLVAWVARRLAGRGHRPAIVSRGYAARPGEVLTRVQQAAAKAAGKEFALESVNCFDVFSGPGLPEGTRSVAFEIRWRHAARTLTDEEANRAMAAVIAALEKGAGWTIRS